MSQEDFKEGTKEQQSSISLRILRTARPPPVRVLHLLSFRLMRGEGVSGGTPGPPCRPASVYGREV
eukprot:7125295-Pyramimonas_sp.AAC.1